MIFQKGVWHSFDAQGHAEQAVQGQDIVCAAFSCLVRTVCRYCAAQDWLSHYQIDNDGFYFQLNETAMQGHSTDIAQLLILGLQDLEREYPQNLKLEVEERE